MNCARCDGAGEFRVFGVDLVKKRPVLRVIPCPSCQGSQADRMKIAKARAALVLFVEQCEDAHGHARAAIEAIDDGKPYVAEWEKPDLPPPLPPGPDLCARCSATLPAVRRFDLCPECLEQDPPTP